jgi:putative tryptophan/tyrosine transport system substrate-binding protein
MKMGKRRQAAGNGKSNPKKKGVFCFTLCALLFSLCASTKAQEPTKVFRIGYLSNSRGLGPSEEAFRQGLRDLGYVEGQNVVIQWRHTKGKLDQLHDLAADLARLGVDCIFTVGVEATRAAKQATSTIPIVMGDADDDPVRQGLVASLARPGGNVTGFISISSDLASKRLELFKEVVPNLSRVAILHMARSRAAEGHVRESQIAARELGMALQSLPLRSKDDLEDAFQVARKQRVQGLVIVNVAGISAYQPLIVALAIKNRLPTITLRRQESPKAV